MAGGWALASDVHSRRKGGVGWWRAWAVVCTGRALGRLELFQRAPVVHSSRRNGICPVQALLSLAEVWVHHTGRRRKAGQHALLMLSVNSVHLSAVHHHACPLPSGVAGLVAQCHAMESVVRVGRSARLLVDCLRHGSVPELLEALQFAHDALRHRRPLDPLLGELVVVLDLDHVSIPTLLLLEELYNPPHTSSGVLDAQLHHASALRLHPRPNYPPQLRRLVLLPAYCRKEGVPHGGGVQ
mmetsp:Transcript_8099/g.34076  ORF Transcript_8099/g.34076 Transcript_8099/m.34076 type:complete len:241 (-) Transcript_8099:28-750(-)